MFDAIVIGGGPAGSATAIRLAQAGMRVRLYERSRFPRAKLCGGFLSAESKPELEALGALDDLRAAGARPVRRVLVSAPSGAKAEADLNAPGLSISRYHLDAILVKRARRVGVEIHEGEDGSRHLGEAPWTVVATGRALTQTLSHPSDGRGDYLKIPSPAGRRERARVRAHAFFGIQASFDNVQGITDQVELDLVPSGYIGLVHQNGHTNVCGLLERQTLRQLGADLDRTLKELAGINPVLKSRLWTARRMTPWKAVGPVAMGLRRLSEGRTFYVGDAACVVDPYVGEGIAMGLREARRIGEALAQNTMDPAAYYARAWHDDFDKALAYQRWIRMAIQDVWLQESLVRGCCVFPRWLERLSEKTRPLTLPAGRLADAG